MWYKLIALRQGMGDAGFQSQRRNPNHIRELFRSSERRYLRLQNLVQIDCSAPGLGDAGFQSQRRNPNNIRELFRSSERRYLRLQNLVQIDCTAPGHG